MTNYNKSQKPTTKAAKKAIKNERIKRQNSRGKGWVSL